MIQEITISNFLSFRDKVTLCFEATKDTFADDYQVVVMADGTRLLRLAMVYGANASGKSNLLKVIDFLNDFWFDKPNSINEETGANPFRLDAVTPSKPSIIDLKFYVGTVRYWYHLIIDSKVVHEEKLYFYKSVQPTMLFDRELADNQSQITYNSSVLKVSSVVKEEIEVKCLPNMSFFVARNQVNTSLPEIDVAHNWIKDYIMPVIDPTTPLSEYAGRKMHKDNDLTSYLLKFVHEADFNVTNIKNDSVIMDVSQDVIDFLVKTNDLDDDVKEKLMREKSIQRIQTLYEHTVNNDRGQEVYYFTPQDQSRGTLKILGIETALYQALKNNAFIAIDEIESSLHPDLVEKVIVDFLKQKSNSQLLVTTHYDPLLDTTNDIIRKDSVWFTEKSESGNTELYSLVDFKGLNRLSSFRRAYRNGNFGGVPHIK